MVGKLRNILKAKKINAKQTTDKDRKQQFHNTNIHQQPNRKNSPQIQKSKIQ